MEDTMSASSLVFHHIVSYIDAMQCNGLVQTQIQVSMLKGKSYYQLRCPVESVHASLDSFHFYYILIAELLPILITPPAAGGSMAALSL